MSDIRTHFPSLKRVENGQPVIFLDGPAGTQVPHQVTDAMTEFYMTSNANTHGQFATSGETDAVLGSVRNKCATLLNAENAGCISLGQNMTTLAYSLSRAFARKFSAGDEVVITQLDHEANRGPWLSLRESGVIVKEINLLPNGKLDYDDAREKITERTKLVAAGWASNILGTINDIQLLRQLSSAVGAWLLVDAVHYVPHFLTDVQSIDCDFLLCSAYKFYGPHVGILYCKPGLLNTLETDRLRTAGQQAPERIETGTLNHAAMAGVGACIDFIADQGAGDSLRTRLESAYAHIGEHERTCARQLWDGLQQINRCTTYGPDFDDDLRAPTISFTVEGKTAEQVCRALASHGINAWDGHFYAIRTTEVLGLEEIGGVTRMGIMAYTTSDEIERTLQCLNQIA